MDTEFVTLVIGSGASVTPGSQPWDFTNILAQPMLLKGQWECCFVTASFTKGAVINSSVFVTLDFLDNTPVADTQIPLLFMTPPITAADPSPYAIQHVTTIPQWKPVIRNTISSVRCRIYSSNGTDIPGTYQSTVQVVLRQIRSE